jgi:carboxymethylenebutenolidase
MSEYISLGRDGEDFQSYLAKPVHSNGKGLVLLGEVYNANHFIRGVADGYAALGYTVLAPDLYWRQQPGEYLDYTPDGQKQARALAAALDIDQAVEDVGRAAEALREQLGQGTVGVLGFCLGGQLAYLAAARVANIDSVVAYYPVQLQNHLDEAPKLRVPTLVHFAENDARTPPDLIQALRDGVAPLPDVDLHVYPAVEHAFGRVGYAPYDHAAATLAAQRTRDFYSRTL